MEYGISLDRDLVWKNGPDGAGLTNNLGTLCKPDGLKEQLQNVRKIAIGDKGCGGDETFNGLKQTFNILDGRFQHDNAKVEIALTAVCMLCSYKVEYEQPLFDIQ
jgi:hypothetical protein